MWNKKGFSLVEMLIAISVFTLAAVMATQVLSEVVSFQKRARLINEVTADVNFVVEAIRREVAAGNIDYEEYFSHYVVQENGPNSWYGVYHGLYSSRFFHPGGPNTKNPDDLGAVCSQETEDGSEICEVYLNESYDYSEGINPYYEKDPFAATAFCDSGRGLCDDNRAPAEVPELYLISEDGTQKTIIAKRLLYEDNQDSNYALGLVRLKGQDLDQNGLIDTFSCDLGFLCRQDEDLTKILENFPFIEAGEAPADVKLPNAIDLAEAFDPDSSEFLPITPLSVNIEEISFFIRPTDDPKKAFDEPPMQLNPSVEMVMTVDLASRLKRNFPGEFPKFTIRTVMNTGGALRDSAYPAVQDVFSLVGNEQPSWITEVLPAALHE